MSLDSFPKLEGQDLFDKITDLKVKDTHKIIEECGYSENGNLAAAEFYENLIWWLNLSSLDIEDEDFDDFKDILFETYGGRCPIIEDGVIIGHYIFRISEIAEQKKWTKKNWVRDNDEGNLEGPFEIGVVYPNQSRYEGFYSFEDAINSQIIPESALSELIRPAYFKLTSDDHGRSLDSYLLEYGESPNRLFKIAEKFGYL